MKMRTIACGLSLILMVGMSTLGLAKPEKVEFCDYNQDLDTWVLKKLPTKAVEKHLRNHDDGFPGGQSAISGTNLDYDCSEFVAPANSGTCAVRDFMTSVPGKNEPLVGQGYARIFIEGVNTNPDLRNVCTQEIYDFLMEEYCKVNSNQVQLQVHTYSPTSTGCASSGCNPVSCP